MQLIIRDLIYRSPLKNVSKLQNYLNKLIHWQLRKRFCGLSEKKDPQTKNRKKRRRQGRWRHRWQSQKARAAPAGQSAGAALLSGILTNFLKNMLLKGGVWCYLRRKITVNLIQVNHKSYILNSFLILLSKALQPILRWYSHSLLMSNSSVI